LSHGNVLSIRATGCGCAAAVVRSATFWTGKPHTRWRLTADQKSLDASVRAAARERFLPWFLGDLGYPDKSPSTRASNNNRQEGVEI
jgi:hypothetical protein